MNRVHPTEHLSPRHDGLDPPIQVAFVGDNPAMADMYRLKLQVDGYAVTLFTTAEGSESAGLGRSDIVYLDIGAQSTAGAAAHRRLRAEARTKHLPIVLLSDRLARQGPGAGLELGIRDFLISSDTIRPDAFWDELTSTSHTRRKNALI